MKILILFDYTKSQLLVTDHSISWIIENSFTKYGFIELSYKSLFFKILFSRTLFDFFG